MASEDQHTADQTSIESHEDQPRAVSVYSQIAELQQSETTKAGFYSAALGCIGRAFASPYAAICVRFSSQTFEEEFHSGPTDPRFWKGAVQGYLSDSLAECRARAKLMSAKNSSMRIGLFSAPLFDDQGSPIGAIALVTRVGSEDARQRIAFLESLAALMVQVSSTIGKRRTEKAADPGAMHQALSRAATFESPEELAFSLTNNLRNKIGCAQVALGVVERQRVRLLSISGLDEIKSQSPGILCIKAAMEECLDFRRILVSQAGDSWGEGSGGGFRLHKEWHDVAHGAAVASIPLESSGDCVAIVSLRRMGSEPFTEKELDRVRSVVEPFSGALQLVRAARRGLLRHARDTVRSALGGLIGPGRFGRKSTAILVPLVMAWFVFGSLPFEIVAPCVVTPHRISHLSAPYDAVLSVAHVVAGDRVSAGQVLCELDARELQLQRDELRAQLTVAQQERLSAVADETPVAARLAAANERLRRTQLEIVERRLERARIRSPFDGVVVRGDLRKRVGGTVRRGESLFEVASLEQWTLEIEIPDSRSSDVQPGQLGRFATRARPEQAQPITLRRVRPTAEVRDGANVYVVEADLNQADGLLRPGMQGFASIEVGRRAVWWVVLHRMVEYFQLRYWL